MSRSKRDILDTEKMLERLATLLAAHAVEKHPSALVADKAREHAEALRRISMTLHNWHELECGASNDYFSSVIVRGRKVPDMQGGKRFEHDDNGKPFTEIQYHGENKTKYWPVADREAGALKRLKAIMARYPALQAYVQGDPRGCALYILKPGDVPDGADVSSCYSRGLAVYR